MSIATVLEEPLNHWVGLDVSKATFDAALMRHGQRVRSTPLNALPAREFARTRDGVAAFLQWLDSLLGNAEPGTLVRCVMESTGRYSVELGAWLVERRASLAPAIDRKSVV